MKHLGKTPPFRASSGEILPGSIAEATYLRLGGLDQWVMAGAGHDRDASFPAFQCAAREEFHRCELGSARRGKIVQP